MASRYIRGMVFCTGLCLCLLGIHCGPAMTVDEFLLPEDTIDSPMVPTDLGLSYEPLEVASSDGPVIRGWYIPAEDATGTVIFSNGQGAIKGSQLAISQATVRLMHDTGFDVVMWDYPGLGESDGPAEADRMVPALMMLIDAVPAITGNGADRIVLAGFSLGTVVSTSAAAKQPPTVIGLFLVGPAEFDTMREGRGLLSLFADFYLDFNQLKALFNPIEDIRQVTVPVMFVSSIQDRTTPFAGAQRLFDAANEPKQLLRLEGDAFSRIADVPSRFAGDGSAHILYEMDNGPAYTEPVRVFFESLRN